MQVGCVPPLEQEDGSSRSADYWSCTPSDKELKLVTVLKESLAVLSAVLHFSRKLEGSCFTIQTDNEALRWVQAMTNTIIQLTQCRLTFSDVSINTLYLYSYPICISFYILVFLSFSLFHPYFCLSVFWLLVSTTEFYYFFFTSTGFQFFSFFSDSFSLFFEFLLQWLSVLFPLSFFSNDILFFIF